MHDIKTKELAEPVKVLDKAQTLSARTKENLVRVGESTKRHTGEAIDEYEDSAENYAIDKIEETSEDIVYETGDAAKKRVKHAVDSGRDAYKRYQKENRQRENERRLRDEFESDRLERDEGRKGRTGTEHPDQYEHDATRSRNESYRNTRKNREEADLNLRKRRYKRCRNVEHVTDYETKKRSIKKTAKSTREAVKTGRRTIETADNTVQNVSYSARVSIKTVGESSKVAIKTAEETGKAAVKTAEVTAKATEKAAVAAAKAAQKGTELVRQAAIVAYKAIVALAKAIVAAVKAIIAAIEELGAAIAAGGWVSVVIIVVIVLILAIVGIVLGIFSSNDENHERTLRDAIVSINEDYNRGISVIEGEHTHDILEISGSRASWPEVLATFSVRLSLDPENPQDVSAITEENEELLKSIFNDMHVINYEVETRTVTESVETVDEDGEIVSEELEVEKTVLMIQVNHKSVDDMIREYEFSVDQQEMLEELLAEENRSLWNELLYGAAFSDQVLVSIAESQLGSVGGETYWRWYGFDSHVSWCACFVSWCANIGGYTDTGIIPSFSLCTNGVNWFREHGQWFDNTEVPESGMLIFYDWENDGRDGNADHVGIVERVEDGIIYCIEGNVQDSVMQVQWPVGWYEILGYGVPAY